MSDILFKKGDIVSLSDIGHNGFFYPSAREAIVLYQTSACTLSWVGAEKKKAFLIPENSIIFSGSPHKKIAVWRKK